MYDITIVAHHVKGEYNYLSDWLSRVLGVTDHAPSATLARIPSLSVDKFIEAFRLYASTTPTGPLPDRRIACRLILTRILTHPELMSTQTMVSLLVTLYNVRHISPSADDQISAVLNGFINSTTVPDRSQGLAPTIPTNLNTAHAMFAPYSAYVKH
jgi:hypothetical protein